MRHIASSDSTCRKLGVPNDNALVRFAFGKLLYQCGKQVSRASPKTPRAAECLKGQKVTTPSLAKGADEDTIRDGISRMPSIAEKRPWGRDSEHGQVTMLNIPRKNTAKSSSNVPNPKQQHALKLAGGCPRAEQPRWGGVKPSTKLGKPIGSLV
jgi:hypothetical protein